ncbi:MAG: ABC transporter permease [Dehalococcoidia bacterium]|nr:MAG: ABC transporter permease [Dehalococcoidia bacterium]
MSILKLVIRDILRRKKRVLYAALGVAIGTMTVIGILTISLAGEERIYDQLEKYGPNLTIVPSIYNLDMTLGNLSLGTLSVGENYIAQEKLSKIREIADREIKLALNINDDGDIAVLAPKLFINTEVNNISVMVVGIEPSVESSIKTWWQISSGKYFNGSYEALVGSITAELLKLDVGDKLLLNGDYLTIVGILEESGSSDDYQIFLPLNTMQSVFGKQGLISSVDIRALCNACPVEYIAETINDSIQGVRAIAVKQIATTEMNLMAKVNNFMLTLAGITLVVGFFGVLNTMVSSINERVKDIGIMRAVGASRRQIIRIFIYEAIIIGILGGFFGYIAGTFLAYVVGPLIFEGIVIAYVIEYLPVSIAIATVVACLATIYPAYHATKIKVADSFRSI